MKRFFIWGSDYSKIRHIEHQLEMQFDVIATSSVDEVEFIRWIENESEKKEDIHLLLELNEKAEEQNCLKVISYLTQQSLPVVVLENGKHLREKLQNLYQTLESLEVYFFNDWENSTKFLNFLEKQYQIPVAKDVEQMGHVKIQIHKFKRLKLLPCDIYLRLSSEKFVKILNKESLLSAEVLEKYLNKGLKFFYLAKEDESTFYQSLTTESLNILKATKGRFKFAKEIQPLALEGVYYQIHQLGISEHIIENVEMMIEEVTESLSKEIEKTWKSWFVENKQDQFLIQHSMALAFLTNAIAKGLSWTSAQTNKKLVVASLFHDIGLELNNKPYIQCRTKTDLMNLEGQMKVSYQNHQTKSLDIVQKSSEHLHNVDQIILEHHERPDGSGFPRGLKANNISSLSCLFIIAEEFYYRCWNTGFSKNQMSIVAAQMGKEFDVGNYKNPYRALLYMVS